MEPVKYFFEANGNRELPEEQQGYALMFPLSAKSKSAITDHLVTASVRSGKKIKVDYAAKSLEINRKHIVKIVNVIDPLYDTVIAETTIDEIYNSPSLGDLYEELSNAVGDISTLKEGIKKK